MGANRRRLYGGIALIAGLIAIGLAALPIPLTPRLRTRLIAALGERFDSQVDLKSLHVSVFPRLRLTGGGLVFRHKGRTDVPPLIEIESFSIDASLVGLMSNPMRIKSVQLQRLDIKVPPGGMKIDDDEKKPKEKRPSPLVVDDLQSEQAVLTILRRDTSRQPRVFEIHQLSMQGTGSDDPWAFAARLTNPKPPGDISTNGFFGPWDTSDPASTPLEGKYEFRNADLGIFDEIKGVLQSTGSYKGILERIEVDGRASVPEFALTDVGHPVPLETIFHSVVDGTSGNTLLQPANATLEKTVILTNGGVVERKGEEGRTVSLDVVINDGRIEDVLRLAVKMDRPPMTGALKLKTSFVLPPGHVSAIDKLQLDGSFEIATARFTMKAVQAKIDTLSQKGQGKQSQPDETVASNLKGRFSMRRGVIRFANVSFEVPGARVDMAGDYAMRAAVADFKGTVRLDAKLSTMTDGMKSFLLKLVEPVFRKNNRTVIPIRIHGPVRDLDVGLDMGGVF